MSQRPNLNFESRMLIDGRLVEAIEGTTFDNVNPATEEVIGACSDVSKRDMEQAIAAARRAFDETDWATNKALRKQCLEELAEALEISQEFRRSWWPKWAARLRPPRRASSTPSARGSG